MTSMPRAGSFGCERSGKWRRVPRGREELGPRWSRSKEIGWGNERQTTSLHYCEGSGKRRRRLLMRVLLVVLMCVGLRAGAQQMVYHVATNVNDYSKGTQGQPFKTLNRGIAAARASRAEGRDVRLVLHG